VYSLFECIKKLILILFIKDTHLAGGYENVPADGIDMTQVDFNEHWLFILKEIIQPIQQKLYTDYCTINRTM
jgi:hypothetical protein